MNDLVYWKQKKNSITLSIASGCFDRFVRSFNLVVVARRQSFCPTLSKNPCSIGDIQKTREINLEDIWYFSSKWVETSIPDRDHWCYRFASIPCPNEDRWEIDSGATEYSVSGQRWLIWLICREKLSYANDLSRHAAVLNIECVCLVPQSVKEQDHSFLCSSRQKKSSGSQEGQRNVVLVRELKWNWKVEVVSKPFLIRSRPSTTDQVWRKKRKRKDTFDIPASSATSRVTWENQFR